MTRNPGLLLVLILALHAAPAPGQVGETAQEARDLRAAIAFAKQKVYPALVNIKVVSRSFSGGRTVRSLGSGSGTIIGTQRHVVTNYHVVRDAVRITCTLPSGEQIAADVVGHDAPTDVSVLKLRLDSRAQATGPLPYATLGDSDNVKVGDMVIAVGNPLSLSSSMTLGVVSNTRRVFLSGGGNELEDLDFGGGDKTGLFTVWIQHDALILPGNSGGPLVNLEGKVIGVNTRGGTGYGFASPSNLVRYVVQQIVEHGKVQRGWLGASFQPVARLGRKQGALTSSVVEDSPAHAAGLRAGDILVSLDDKPVVARFIEEIPLLYGRIAELRPGTRASVTFERDGKPIQAGLVVAAMEDFIGREVELRDLGVTLQDITSPMARARGYPDTKGVVVTGIRAGEPFEEAKPRVRRGDVIVKVAGTAVTDIASFQDAFASAGNRTAGSRNPGSREVPIEFRRDRELVVTVVEIEEDSPRQRGGELAKAWLGVRAQVLLPRIAKAIGLPGQAGFRITEVYPDTKAAAAGLKVGDVLTAIDGERLKASRPQDERDLRNQIENHVIGEEVEMAVLRGGKKITLEVELEESPASSQDAGKAKSDLFELKVRELTRMDRIARDLPRDMKGVLVTEATAGGWAHIAGISDGQVILRIGGHEVWDPGSFEKAMEDIVARRPEVVLVFLRTGRRTTFRFIEPDWSAASGGNVSAENADAGKAGAGKTSAGKTSAGKTSAGKTGAGKTGAGKTSTRPGSNKKQTNQDKKAPGQEPGKDKK